MPRPSPSLSRLAVVSALLVMGCGSSETSRDAAGRSGITRPEAGSSREPLAPTPPPEGAPFESVVAAADSFFSLEAWPQAARTYRRALSMKPDDASVALCLADACLAHGDADGAGDAFRRALALHAEEALVGIGRALEAQGQAVAATLAFEEAVRQHPNDGRALGFLARSRLEQSRFEDAVSTARRALELGWDAPPPPRRPSLMEDDVTMTLGLALLATGDPAGATETLSRLDEPHPVRVDAALGHAALALGRHTEAIEHYRRAESRGFGNAAVHRGIATALAQLGRFEESLPSFEAAIRTGMDDAQTFRDYGRALVAVEQWADARMALSRALGRASEDAEGHAMLGAVLFALEEWTACLSSLDRAQRLGADVPGLDRMRGVALLEEFDFAGSAAAFRRARDVDPSDVDACLGHARALISLGRRDEAVDALTQAAALDPESSEIPRLLQQARGG